MSIEPAGRGGPLEGGRHVEVTGQRLAVDYAHMLKDIADEHFPEARKIVLVQDNLDTHKPASLYEAFAPAEARRLVERFEWHYTPKHGSWLDMAECELGVSAKQCLDCRIPDRPSLAREIRAWQSHRNKRHAKAERQFTTPEARIKLKTQATSVIWLTRAGRSFEAGLSSQPRAR